jgi:ATP-dependent Clp protease ATP-binding subunit ClpA
MFDRLTSGARKVVDLAQAEAQSMHHAYIGTEHLLLGLLGEEHGIAARTLRAAGVTAPAIRDDVQRLVTDLPLSGPDAEALRAIGIDVDVVRARIEASFGPGSLERARLGDCLRRRPSRGGIPFSRRSRKVMDLSLREARRLGHDYIGAEPILLALLGTVDGLAAQILADSGVPADDLRRSVLAAVGRVA